MPLVTATPRGQNNGQVLTEFIDSVGTSSVTFTYPKTQESLSLRNIGTKAITVTVGGTSQALQPGQRWDKTADFTAFSIISSSGVQAFEATADEKGSVFSSPEGQYFAASGTGGTTTSSALKVIGKKNHVYFDGTHTYAGTKGGRTYCQRIIFACDCYDPQFLFMNPISSGGAIAGNVINLKVTLETVSNPVDGTGDSTFYPLSVNGSRQIAVNPDQSVLTDKIPLSFTKGQIAYLRTFVSSTNNNWPTGISLSAAYAHEGVHDGNYANHPASATSKVNNSVYSTDGAATNVTGAPTHENSWRQPGLGATYAADATGYGSALCVGKASPTAAAYAVVANIGDSISRGAGTDGNFTWGIGHGFMQQAINAADGAWIDMGLTGQSASGFLGVQGFDRWSFLDYCTHALVEYGVNDISLTTASDTRITEVTSDLQAIFSICKARGVGNVRACLPVVRTNTTDAWATTANQTAYNNGFKKRASGGNNTYQDLINWLKGNSVTPNGGSAIAAPVGLDGYFDTAAAVVTLKGDNTPVWIPGMVWTADSMGVHPSDAGHMAMATMIPASSFAV